MGKGDNTGFQQFSPFPVMYFEGFFLRFAKPHSSVGSMQDLRTGGRWFDPLAQPILFLNIDDSHCDRSHSSLTTVHCFDNGYYGKAACGFEKILYGILVKRTPVSVDRCTGHRDIAEIMLKMALNTIQMT